MPEAFRERVLAVVRSLPAGVVASYGEVAEEAGFPGAARGVGGVLRTSEGVPWWRVVMASGRLAPGKELDQAARLRAEGITVDAATWRVRGERRAPPGSGGAAGP